MTVQNKNNVLKKHDDCFNNSMLSFLSYVVNSFFSGYSFSIKVYVMCRSFLSFLCGKVKPSEPKLCSIPAISHSRFHKMLIIDWFLCYFYPFEIALSVDWVVLVLNIFLIACIIKHWKSQCWKMLRRICHFYYVNIQLKCHKFA